VDELPVMSQEFLNGLVLAEVAEVREYGYKPF
jgi:hypothetical protein